MPTEEQCVMLKKKLDDTAEELHKQIRITHKSIEKVDNKLSEHIKEFNIHEELEKAKYDEYLDAQKVNTAAINHLVKQMQIQSEDTKGLIETWKNIMSLASGISWLRNGILWICTTIVGLATVYALFTLGVKGLAAL
jgi:hypothetical protein